MVTRRHAGSVRESIRSRAGDAGGFIVALVIGGMATEAGDPTALAFPALNEPVGLLAALALWWRRRAPVVVAVLAFAAAVVAPLAAGAAIVGVFTVAALRSLRTVIALGALYVAPGVVALVLAGDASADQVTNAIVVLLLTAGAIGWGVAARSRHQAMDALADRADRAEAEQQARVAEARAAERSRIAGEMHDVLAHRLSLLSLHAGAIEVRPDAPREELSRAAAVVRANAHVALDELRTVIGVLREDGNTGLSPVPTAADLASLLDEASAAGMRIDRTQVTAPFASLPAELGRHVFRVVQEGLTNARKHAPGTPVEVSVTGAPGEGLRVEVTNRWPTAPRAVSIPGASVGLIGLRERVELAGGVLSCGPDLDGSYLLRAELPWPA